MFFIVVIEFFWDELSPLSDLRHLIFYFVSFSTSSLNILKNPKASDFFFRRHTQVILVKSSMRSMKYSSPFSPLLHVGPHRSVWTSSSGLVVECSFVLNSTLVCFPCWQDSQIPVFGLWISGISLTAWYSLILIRFPKWICPILLCQSQFSSSLPKQHFYFLISSNMYMLLGVLEAVATNFPESSRLILQSFEVNVSTCPWSHIWLTLSRLCLIFSMSRTSFATTSLLPRVTVPFPSTLDELSFPKVTVPFFLVTSKRYSCFQSCV